MSEAVDEAKAAQAARAAKEVRARKTGPVSALPGARFEGYCTVEEAGLCGMVTLRADLSLAKVARAVKAVTGAEMPAPLKITSGTRGRVAWMSPDELLLFVEYAEAGAAVARLDKALATSHALAVDVSDARALFRLTGARAREGLMKLTPADIRRMAPGEFRRTRLAQVPAALYMPDEKGFEIIAFRSVAGYVFDLLSNAARPGGEVGWPPAK